MYSLSIRWISRFIPVLLLAFMLVSCNDDDSSGSSVGDHPFAVTLSILGSDATYTYYTVPFADVMSGSLSAVGNGVEQPGYYDYTQIDNTIYSLGGLGQVDVESITFKESSGKLKESGNTSFSDALSDIVKGDDNTLVAVSMSSSSSVVQFYTLDINSVTVESSKSIQVSELTSESGPSYSGMVVSGDYLYLSYYISDPSNYATPSTDTAVVAVFSYPELEFQKVIKDTRTGPIGGFNTKCGLIKDESGNVYALSNSNPANGYSQTTKSGAILKINSGETEFDEDYYFDVESVTGGLNIAHLMYLEDGMAFAEVNMEANSDQTIWSDSPLQSAVVDLANQTISYIDGVPEHSGDGRRLAALYDDGYVYLCIPETAGISVYQMDVENLTATQGAEVEASFVAGFFKF